MGGCTSKKFQETYIQKQAVRNALQRALDENPSCSVPVFKSYAVLEEEYFEKCSWIEQYRVKVLVDFECK